MTKITIVAVVVMMLGLLGLLWYENECWKAVKKWLNHRKINRVFPQAKGEHLDNIGEIWGVKRDKVKRLFWHFRESDKKYRIRMLEHMRSLPKEFGRKNDQNANDRK